MLNIPGEGVVASLAHPDGNVTGLAQAASAEIAGKRLQLLKDAVPGIVRVAVLYSPDVARTESKFLELAAQFLGIELTSVSVQGPGDIAGAFAAINTKRPDALFVVNSGLSFTKRRVIVERAAEIRLPAMFAFKEAAEEGGLLSYGSDRVDVFRRAAIFAGKILKGAKPADLPIEQPAKYELVVNLKTAKALDLDIPRSLLLVADEIIE
jgi:putative ABC transport system substrate-binding protein